VRSITYSYHGNENIPLEESVNLQKAQQTQAATSDCSETKEVRHIPWQTARLGQRTGQ
jgi:hypothetical protein